MKPPNLFSPPISLIESAPNLPPLGSQLHRKTVSHISFSPVAHSDTVGHEEREGICIGVRCEAREPSGRHRR
jgi:hypothetical protein